MSLGQRAKLLDPKPVIFGHYHRKNLKDFFVCFFLLCLIHSVGYWAVKRPVRVKTKLNLTKHNFFVTKATDLKTIFLKNL